MTRSDQNGTIGLPPNSRKYEIWKLFFYRPIATRELFARRSTVALKRMLNGTLLLVIDEAQKVPDIGNALKLMVDTIPDLRVLITGSSAFDAENYTGEPLTGRKMTFKFRVCNLKS